MPSSARTLRLAALLCGALAAPSYPALSRAQPPVTAPGGRDLETANFELMLGEQHVLPAQGVRNYSTGVQGVIDVRLTGDASRFVVVGIKPGTTTLLFLMTDGSQKVHTFTVRDPNASQTPTTAVVDPLAVAPAATVRLDLYFVQVDRQRSLDMGINLPSALGSLSLSYGYDIAAGGLLNRSAILSTSPGGTGGTSGGFVARLDMAQSQGWAKVGRHVAVVTTNGNEATYESGGEFNTVNVQGVTAAVYSIKYGTNLTIQPRYDAKTGRVELAVTADVSDLTATAGTVPGRSRSAVTTVANLALGESLAIAGLIAQNEERGRSGFPFLSQIPILGMLFGKHTQRALDSENMVFIAPSIIEPLKHPRGREFLGTAIREFRQYKGQSERGDGVFPGKPWEFPDTSRPKTP